MYRRIAGFCNSQRDNPYYDCPVDPQRFTAARLLSSLCRSSLAYALHLVIGHFVMVAVILSDMLDQPVEDLHPSQIEGECRHLVARCEGGVGLDAQILHVREERADPWGFPIAKEFLYP